MGKNEKITVEVDPDDLGVASRVRHPDQDYRDRALTPVGGKAPGEDGKPKDPVPDRSGLTASSLVAAASK